ncbi:MAG: sulfotransferase domain-containing protein [Phycisphaerales bacterium JB065]
MTASPATITSAPHLDPEHPRTMSFAILGAAKSGTTWMQRLLSAHPQVHCAESRAFGTYFDPKHPTAIHITIDSFVDNLRRYYHPPADAGDGFYERMLFSILDAIGQTTLAESGKAIYGEKITPYWGTGEQVLERLAAYNPALRFVHLVRDPRDVVVSGFVHQANIHIGSNHTEADRYRHLLDNQQIDDEQLDSLLSLWIDSNRAAANAASRLDHTHLLRYEDLLAAPTEQARALFEFIGADTNPATVEHSTQQASFRALSGGRDRGEEDRTNFFRKGIAGDWVNWLSEPQTQRIVEQAGDLMERFGYSTGNNTGNDP